MVLPCLKVFAKTILKGTVKQKRRRGGMTVLKSGQEWTLPAQLGQLKTGQGVKRLFLSHLWYSDDLQRL